MERNETRRRSKTEARWRRELDNLAESGLSLRRYAELRGLNPNTLTWWRYEVRRRDVGSVAAEGDVAAQLLSREEATFLPVKFPATLGRCERDAAGTIEITFASGHVIRTSGDVDEAQLRAVLSSLGLAC